MGLAWSEKSNLVGRERESFPSIVYIMDGMAVLTLLYHMLKGGRTDGCVSSLTGDRFLTLCLARALNRER